MTVDDPHGEPLLRGALGVIVVADLVSFFFFIANARAIAPASAFTNVSDVFSRMPVVGAVVSIGVAGAVAFAWRPGRIWEGLVSLGALTLLSTAHAQLYGSPWRHLYYSGLCLSGWLLGLGLGRHRGAATDESLARIGSIALLGAAYLNAGISKLAFGGIDWLSGLPIQAVVVGQDGLVADSILSSYRTWVAETPAAASLFAIATVGFELAGPLMIAGRKTRLCVALGLLAMHANIYVLTRILYWESMVLLVLFGVLRRPAGDSGHGDLLGLERPAVHHCRHGAGIVRVFCRHSSEPPVYAVARNEAGNRPGHGGYRAFDGHGRISTDSGHPTGRATRRR